MAVGIKRSPVIEALQLICARCNMVTETALDILFDGVAFAECRWCYLDKHSYGTM
jgi:hypothetical protein